MKTFSPLDSYKQNTWRGIVSKDERAEQIWIQYTSAMRSQCSIIELIIGLSTHASCAKYTSGIMADARRDRTVSVINSFPIFQRKQKNFIICLAREYRTPKILMINSFWRNLGLTAESFQPHETMFTIDDTFRFIYRDPSLGLCVDSSVKLKFQRLFHIPQR